MSDSRRAMAFSLSIFALLILTRWSHQWSSTPSGQWEGRSSSSRVKGDPMVAPPPPLAPPLSVALTFIVPRNIWLILSRAKAIDLVLTWSFEPLLPWPVPDEVWAVSWRRWLVLPALTPALDEIKSALGDYFTWLITLTNIAWSVFSDPKRWHQPPCTINSDH